MKSSKVPSVIDEQYLRAAISIVLAEKEINKSTVHQPALTEETINIDNATHGINLHLIGRVTHNTPL